MALFNLYDDEATLDELTQLIANQTCEKRTIDYKLTLELDGDEKKKEFLADIVSFANTLGGLLIYGMEEEAGIPTKLIGIESANFDILKGQIESIIRDGIAPKLNTHTITDVNISDGRKAIIIKIPQSWTSPHLVLFKRSPKFFARNSSHSRYQLEISEIRSSVIASENFYDRFRNFRLERVSKLLNNQAPVWINENPKFVIHIIPFNAFNYAQQIDMSSDKWLDQYKSTEYNEYRKRHNFDGYLIHSPFDNNSPADHYIQYFRNGEVEIVDTSCTTINQGNKLIYNNIFEDIIRSEIPLAVNSILNFNIGLPIVVMLSVLTIKGYVIWLNSMRNFRIHSYPIDRDNLLINEIIIQNIEELSKAITYKPLFDPVWNACGIAGSLNYNSDGVWSTE
ncbi:MAG: AlbA family DNA-binding domain-containing protein [Ignavibacteriaceae bacterium]